MQKTTDYGKHTVALFVILFLGEGILSLPAQTADKNLISAFFLAGIIGFLLLCLVFAVTKYSLNNSRFLALVLYVTACLYSAFIFAENFKAFIGFSSEMILNGKSKILCIVIFSLTLAYFVSRRYADLLKFSLLSAVFTVLIIVFFFLADEAKYYPENLTFFDGNFKDLIKETKPYLSISYLPVLLLPLFQKEAVGEMKFKYLLIGFIISVLFGALLLTFMVLLFGTEFSAGVKYPFSSAVSTISVGRLFTRLDGFFFFLCFTVCLIKCTFLVKTVIFSLKKMSGIIKKP